MKKKLIDDIKSGKFYGGDFRLDSIEEDCLIDAINEQPKLDYDTKVQECLDKLEDYKIQKFENHNSVKIDMAMITVNQAKKIVEDSMKIESNLDLDNDYDRD